jgi:hypothetical protein
MPFRHARQLSLLMVQQLGVGRGGDVLGLHRGVDSYPFEVPFAQSATVMATRRLSASKSSSLGQWPRSECSCGKLCWKNSSPVKCWR